MKHETFTVDAALLQELGERLIGRAHIALAELIKNSYDADAIVCQINFEEDRITIADDGHGISESDFLNHWMRIGTTHKAGQRTSQTLGRSLTGSKGIGRLSAQFLASEMTLESTSIDQPDKTILAIIDWERIEHGKGLDTVEVLWEARSKRADYPSSHPTGTRIELRRLRTQWDTDSLTELGNEIWFLRSPFDPSTRPPTTRDPEDFYVEIAAPGIEGALAAFDKTRIAILQNWRARITGHVEHGRRYGKANVTVTFKRVIPPTWNKRRALTKPCYYPSNPT